MKVENDVVEGGGRWDLSLRHLLEHMVGIYSSMIISFTKMRNSFYLVGSSMDQFHFIFLSMAH